MWNLVPDQGLNLGALGAPSLSPWTPRESLLPLNVHITFLILPIQSPENVKLGKTLFRELIHVCKTYSDGNIFNIFNQHSSSVT